jgi:hypothetical protein
MNVMTRRLSPTELAAKLGRPLTRLEREALEWLNSNGEDYEDGWRGAFRNLAQSGCEAGTVGCLVYYRDTVRFYRRYEKEIDKLLGEVMSDMGVGPGEIFGERWDSEDPLAKGDLNRNLLAWFGFEMAARVVAEAGGYVG